MLRSLSVAVWGDECLSESFLSEVFFFLINVRFVVSGGRQLLKHCRYLNAVRCSLVLGGWNTTLEGLLVLLSCQTRDSRYPLLLDIAPILHHYLHYQP